MIKEARVSFSAVRAIKDSAQRSAESAGRFSKGIECINEFQHELNHIADTIKEQIAQMQTAQDILRDKIGEIERKISLLKEECDNLRDRLSDLEDRRNCIDETITCYDENGIQYETSNPEYEEITDEIYEVESELENTEQQLDAQETRLEQARMTEAQLESHIDKMNAALYSLHEKSETCRQLNNDIDELRTNTMQKSAEASEKLGRIEKLIQEYLRIKLNIGHTVSPTLNPHITVPNVQINVQINRTAPKKNHHIDNMYKLTEDEIQKHQIRFDANGRIVSYDGRTYGGQYNSYEMRLNRTIKESSLTGYYESGIRGESKFIPSDRTAEGIRVKELLSHYGLEGIVYRNAEPDFEVCSEAVVEINNMTGNRPGNFMEASRQLAKLWNAQKHDGRTDWTPREIDRYRQLHCLTWHEKCDTKTMVLVRTEINDYFKHSGGVSECKTRDNSGGGFDE